MASQCEALKKTPLAYDRFKTTSETTTNDLLFSEVIGHTLGRKTNPVQKV